MKKENFKKPRNSIFLTSGKRKRSAARYYNLVEKMRTAIDAR